MDPLQENCKRSGQIHIPAFGNWDYANDTPITQYFECARQAGLLRYSSSSGESDPYVRNTTTAAGGDLYAIDDHRHHRHLHKPSRYHAAVAVAPPRKTRVRDKRGANVKEVQRRQVKKVCDVAEPPRRQQSLQQNFNNNDVNKKKLHPQHDVVTATTVRARPPKAVDEDLYKIPPELLHSSKRKKMPGFFSCLVPACGS